MIYSSKLSLKNHHHTSKQIHMPLAHPLLILLPRHQPSHLILFVNIVFDLNFCHMIHKALIVVQHKRFLNFSNLIIICIQRHICSREQTANDYSHIKQNLIDPESAELGGEITLHRQRQGNSQRTTTDDMVANRLRYFSK